VVLAAIVLPMATYFGAVEFLSERQPQVAAAPPDTTVAPKPRPAAARCPSRFTRPRPGTATRTAPLAAIRAHMSWTDEFLVDEMRTWRAADGQRNWYVKARQATDQSRRGRWLVGEQEDGQRLVLASADFDTKGYAAGDWELADGQKAPTGVAGCLAGT
jgi:hypothetical protein